MTRLAITLGDPAGIGPEVVLKALSAQRSSAKVCLFGSWELTRQLCQRAKLPLPAVTPRRSSDELGDDPLEFVDVGETEQELRFGQIDPAYGRVALRSIDLAIDAIERSVCDGLVTAPLQKEAILAAGSDFPGHTELLAARAGLRTYGRDFAMYFDSPRLRVALLSVHVSLSKAITAITAEAVADLAALLDREFPRLHGRKPKIGVAGLNPHAGEGGHFGHEEKIIAEGIELARQRQPEMSISGPNPADTIFLHAARGRFDVVLALYHDQGLIPVKTLDFEQSVNVTLGLPYLRASVDHGTAFDIAGRGVADATPMRYAIEWALERKETYKA